MKQGFTVEHIYMSRRDNCILLCNGIVENVVLNIPMEIKYIEDFKGKDSIGVWKIKSLKN